MSLTVINNQTDNGVIPKRAYLSMLSSIYSGLYNHLLLKDGIVYYLD